MNYKHIEGFEDYIIFKTGKIFGKKRNKFLKYCLDTYGYYKLSLYKNGKSYNKTIHRLLALHFIKNDNPEIKTSVDHIDRDKTNNNLSNLRWASSSTQELNKNILKSNKTGITGVCYQKNHDAFMASIYVNKKHIRKSFACKKYGYENAKQLAILERIKYNDIYIK